MDDITISTLQLPLQRIGSKTNAVNATIDNVVVSEGAYEDPTILDSSTFTVTSDNENPLAGSEGPVELAFDGNTSTFWHSNYTPYQELPATVEIDMNAVYNIDKFSYLPRQSGTNGIITEYSLYYKLNADDEWTALIENGTWAGDSSLKNVKFDAVEARYLRFVATEGMSDSGRMFASAAEIYVHQVYEQPVEPGDPASDAAVTALQNMVDKAIALGSEDEALNAAIEAAQAVLAKEAPTSAEVVTALLDLSEAMQALNTDESVDALREDVQATIDFIKEHILSNVEGLRPGKVQALKDAVDAAQTLVNDPTATADQLKAANKAMTKAAQELWEIVSKAELDALIEAANGYLDGDYTAESLNALQAAIEAAQAVAINDDATTAEVTEAITNLSNAIAGLESIRLDTSALEHEIELVNEMLANLDDYVPSSVEGLADKLADAQNVLENAASQAEIDEATKTLREARLSARTKADVSALEELVAYINSLDLSAYTLDSVVPVNRMMSKLTQAMNDEEITQEKVDELAAEMQAAIDGLQPVSEGSVTTPDSTDTAAGAMSTTLFALMAAAGAAVVAAYRRKRS